MILKKAIMHEIHNTYISFKQQNSSSFGFSMQSFDLFSYVYIFTGNLNQNVDRGMFSRKCYNKEIKDELQNSYDSSNIQNYERKSEQAHIPHAPTLLENAVYNEWQFQALVTGNLTKKGT